MNPFEKKPERFPYKPDKFREEIARIEEEFLKAFNEGRDFGFGFSLASVNGQPVEQRIFRIPDAQTQNREYQEQTQDREPLVDVLDEKDNTRILVDLPGVEKKDIQLTAEDNTLHINVNTENRKYHKRLELAHAAKNPVANYRNGVLEIKIKKDEPEDIKIN